MKIKFPRTCRTHFFVFLYSSISLLIILLSIPASTTDLTPRGLNLDFNKASELSKTYFDSNRVSMEAYEYLADHWKPRETSFNIAPKDFPTIQDSFQSTFFDKWLDDSFYSQSKPFETKKYSYKDNCEIIEQTRIRGRPRVTLIEPDLSGIDNITVPVLSMAEADSVTPEIITVKRTVKIGFNFDLPRFDKDLYFRAWLARIHLWGRFEFRLHFEFPVELTIRYPKEVIQGGLYSFECRLDALNLPSYNEFEFLLDIDFGAALEINYLGTWYSVPGLSKSFSFYKHVTNSYKTPLAGEFVQFNLRDIDIIGMIKEYYLDKKEGNKTKLEKAIDKFGDLFEAGVGLGTLDFFGDKVLSKLAIYTEKGKFDGRNVGWTRSGSTKRIDFRISNAKHVKFSVSDLICQIREVTWNPNLYLKFKHATITVELTEKLKLFDLDLPLDKWFNEHRFPLPPIPLGNYWQIPSGFSYSTLDLPFVPEASYDYSFRINEITPLQEYDEKSPSLRIHDQLYLIEMQNLGGRSDTLYLEAIGLPKGYRATFDRTRPYYGIGPNPSRVILHISPPDRIDVPPGERTFDIRVTSQTLNSVHHGNASNLIEGVPFIVPEIIDLDFELEQDPTFDYEVIPRTYNPIKFFGGNGGNRNDTILVNATLTTDKDIYTWKEIYPVDPWASGDGQYFKDDFGFKFDINDVFPPPGIYLFEIQATSLRNPNVSKHYIMSLYFPPVYGVIISINPYDTTMFADWEETFRLTLRNIGNVPENYTLTSAGWDEFLSLIPKVNNCEMLEIREISIYMFIPDPGSVPVGLFSFRIKIASDQHPSAIDFFYVGIKLLEPDKVPPGIVYIEPLISQDPISYPQSSLTLGPIWKAYDEYPDKYTIYFNGSFDSSGSWLPDVPVQVPVNQLPVGYYNLTIFFNDTSGNIASEHLWINITDPDIEIPQITLNDSSLILPKNFATSQSIIWEILEDHLFNVTLYRNGTILPMTDYTIEIINNNSKIRMITHLIEPGSLIEGIYNYTLLIQDMGNNYAFSTFLLNISSDDTKNPVIINTPSSSAILSRGETISLNCTDLYPDYYELWINSAPELKGTWKSRELIIFQIDDLNLTVGTNNLEFYVYDLSGNFYYHSWDFLLEDIDPPILLVEPVDSTFFEHNLSQFFAPYWHLQDNDPRLGSYFLYQDNILVKEGSWSSINGTIYVPISNLEPGIYLFEVDIRDASGNPIQSSVEITIKDIIVPYILSIENIDYEPLYTANWFEWIITESFPSSYQLYLDDELIDEGFLSKNFTIVFVPIDSHALGIYNYSFVVSDESGNIGKESVLVKVTDNTQPLITPPPDIIYSEGSEGGEIIWEIIEANPYNFSLYRNDQLVDSGILTSMNLTTTVTGLELGDHLYSLIVYDEQGLSHSCSCLVIVLDFTAPIISHISDCRFVAGDPDAKLIWQADDLHPAKYTIKLGGEEIYDGSWDGDEITMNLIGWSSGIYTLQLQVFDTSGNIVTDEVKVEIVEEENETNLVKTSPSFSLILGLLVICILVGLEKRKRFQLK